MTDKERIEINNLAVAIIEDSLWPKERFKAAKRIFDLTKDKDESPRDWTPCAEGKNLPRHTRLVIICYESDYTVDGVKYHEVTVTEGYRAGKQWWTIWDKPLSKNQKVLAWMPKPAPYRADQNANKRAEEKDVET